MRTNTPRAADRPRDASPWPRRAAQALVGCVLASHLAPAGAGASAPTDRELLEVCLDTFEGERRDGPRFTREYARHVLTCNFRIDMLTDFYERRDAYEGWRTEVYERDLERISRAPAKRAAPAAPAGAPAEILIDGDTLRFARCLTARADRLALTEPDLDQDPARARLLAKEMADACLDEAGLR